MTQTGSRKPRLAGLLLLLLLLISGLAGFLLWNPEEAGLRGRSEAFSESRASSADSADNPSPLAAVENINSGANRQDDDTDEPVTALLDIYGSVRGPSGERMAGIEVLARAFSRRDDPAFGLASGGVAGKLPAPLARAATSDDGSFLLKSVPMRPLLIVARGVEHASAICVLSRRELLGRPARFGPLTLQLTQGFTIRGRVLAAGGEPARGALIRYEMERPTALSESEWCDFGAAVDSATAADSDGFFQFVNVPAPRRELQIVATRWGGGASVTVPAASWPPSELLEMQLVAGPVHSGIVMDENENPVPGANIGFGRARALSGHEGSFQLQVDPRDRAFAGKLVISAPGYAVHMEDFDPRVATPSDWRIRLGRGNGIAGRVMNDRGEPVEGAIISFEGRALLPGSLPISDSGLATALARLHAWEVKIVRSAADGTFRADLLPGEPLLVSARVTGLPSNTRPVSVTPPADNITIQIPQLPAGYGNIEGKVVDRATRRTILNYKLFAVTKWGVVQALVDHDGNFRLMNCPSGRLTLRVAPRGEDRFTPVERIFTLEAGEDRKELLIDVGGEGIVKINVEIPQGVNAAELEAMLLPVEGDALGDATPIPAKWNRAFQWEHVTPGLYAIVMSGGSLAFSGAPRIRVTAGQLSEAKLNLTNGAMLLVAVRGRDESAATLAPFGIRVIDAANGAIVYDQRPGTTRTIAGAGAKFTVAPGRYSVRIDRVDQTLAERVVDVTAADGGLAVMEIEADPPK